MQRDPEHAELRHLLEYADVKSQRILEVGCGEGRLTWGYAGVAGRVTGIDLDHEALRVAKIERPSDLEDKSHFARADAVHLPFAAGAFETCILAWSF
jgi:ubiquinone/menaquinone biosynthesis C-methylase UbiE